MVPRILQRISAALLLLASPAAAAGSPREIGTPFITSYDYREYGAHSQNWGAVQDDRGVMYFANGNCVLRFDGVSWETIPVANSSIVRSVAVDPSGTVFAGAVNELGYLRSDAAGNQVYVSLLGELDPEDRNPGDVWRTWATADGVFFWTFAKLFRWRDGRFESWAIGSQRVPGMIRGRLYYNQQGAGLKVFEDGAFRALPGSEELGDVTLMVLLPYGEDRILAGARDGRLWILSPAAGQAPDRLSVELNPFPTAADDYLARHKLYGGVLLPGGGFALATMTGGSLAIDSGGSLRHRFTKANGLPDDSVWGLYVDREHGLWHALNQGLARVELGTPITAFGEVDGLEGTVESIARYQGALHLATSLGFYRLAEGRIVEIERRDAPYWSLLAFEVPGNDRPRATGARNAALLVGSTLGVFEYREGELRQILETRNAFELYQSGHRPEILYVGDITGVAVLRLAGGQWVSAGRLDGVDKEVRSLFEDDAGRLWLGTHFDGLMRVRLDADPGAPPRVAEIQRFGLEHGLPSLKSLKIGDPFGRMLFASAEGLLRFDEEAQRFEPSDEFGPDYGHVPILRWERDRDDNVWLSFHGGEMGVAVRRGPGAYDLDKHRLKRLGLNSTHDILAEPDGVVWFGGVDGLYRLETPGRPPQAARERPFSAWIRRVSVAGPGGETLYGGGRVPSWTPPVLPYAGRILRFEYAMPVFDGGKANRYRSRLGGLEETWNDWTDETYRDFTSLREGRYRFEVEGRDVYHRASETAAFDFRVLPPWYRSWWAYALYALALASASCGLLSWLVRRARLAMEVQRLAEANALMRRTERERQQFVRELETKNKEMERFIYTVSHDLKSPLISIRGFLGMLQKDMDAGQQSRMRHDMERIHAATGKMAHLVEELLELSRIGRQTNEPQQLALSELAREAADQVAGPIAERGVELVISPELPSVKGDRLRLRAMLQNLIENGVKYMGEQPAPRIEIDHVALASLRQDAPNGGETVFRVRDNGAGIDPRYQKKIFGLFERLSTDTEGTGVGLALVQRIVEVHGGRIWVESAGEGAGSTFCFTLPGRDSRAP